MFTAIAVLLLSAVGGGIVGAYLTNSYPADNICQDCRDKAQYQEQMVYERVVEHNELARQEAMAKIEAVEEQEQQEYIEQQLNEEYGYSEGDSQQYDDRY
jgi:esterase/lipase